MNFSFDIQGQVNQIRLPVAKALWPLFETVVNAIQSIEDSPNQQSGRIEIEAIRYEDRQIGIDGKEELSHFHDFVVKDNGNGFDEKNYKSFCTAYSRLKIGKGCKGIGRFLWLKAFRNVHVSSYYYADGWKLRDFSFNLRNNNESVTEEQSLEREYCTTIRLEGFENPYRDSVTLEIETLARKIIEHCLPYFLSKSCPKITLKDSYGEQIVLNDYYKKHIEDSLHQDKIEVKGKELRIYHFLITDTADKHELHFCANSREVKTYDLSKRIPNLQKKIINEATSYYYVGYLAGDYLDSIVSTDRMSFSFGEEGSFVNGITEEDLLTAACEYIKSYLDEDLSSIDKEKRKQIDDYVHHKNPKYRYLLNQSPSVYDSIPAGLSDEKLDLELHKKQQAWEQQIYRQGKDLDRKVRDQSISEDDYDKLFEEYCRGVTNLSQACLAEYVVKRKVIVQLLEKALEYAASGKYNSEASVHSIICPMRKTSDQIPFEDMNLWLIDDRLAYHYYLASDIPMSKLEPIDINSNHRMDIAVFDSPIAVSSKKSDFSSISIIEFKKPGRNDYTDEKNPIAQVYGYVEDIRGGKVKQHNGRPFGNVNNMAFYCYVIADMSDTLRRYAKNYSLQPTPDQEGYYGYNSSYDCYVEVISYDKLLKDAKDRNQILFDKLFAPNVK